MKYKLYVDRMHTYWDRIWYEVEADSLDEAINKCINDEEDYVDIEDLTETIRDLTPEENDGEATVEVYKTDNDEKVYDNK